MAVYLWWVPQKLFPEATASAVWEDAAQKGAAADAAKRRG